MELGDGESPRRGEELFADREDRLLSPGQMRLGFLSRVRPVAVLVSALLSRACLAAQVRRRPRRAARGGLFSLTGRGLVSAG